MASRFSIEAVFKAIDKVTAPVRRMQNRVGKFIRSMQRGFIKLNRAVSKLASGIKRMAVVGTAAFVGMGFALGNLITTGAEFGRAIGSAAAKFPDKIKRGTKEFRELEKAARDVGATTEFTATQAAKGLNFLAKAGFSAKFSTKALADIVDFATASEIELAEAADIASDALGAFGLDSKDVTKKMAGMQRVMDVMSLTANSTNTSVAELFEAMKKGGPISVAAGSNIETFSAIMGTLASNGIKAAQAGTASKNVTLALAGVGNKAAKTFKRLGIDLQDSTGNMRDQLDVLDDLRTKLKDVGEKRKVGIIAAIFGKIPIASAAILLSDTGKKVRALRGELEKAGGSSKRTAGFIRDDVKGSLDGLTSAIEGVKISIFSLNEGPLKQAIDNMTTWVRANEKLIATNIGEFLLNLIENLSNIVTWIKRIAIGLAVFFTFAAILKVIVGVMTAFSLLVAAGASPFVLMAGGIIAATTALTVLISKLEVFQTLGGAVGEGLFDLFNDQYDPNAPSTNTVTPQDRIARTIDEQRTTNTSEIKLTTEGGTNAEVTSGRLGAGLSVQQSGAF